MRQTILIFQFGDLGDTILTVPAIRAIRNRYAGARLVLVGKQVAADYVTPLGLVDDVILVDKHLLDRPLDLLNPRAIGVVSRLLLRLRSERADIALLFHHLVSRWGTRKFALLSLATGAKRRVGLDDGHGWFLTHAVRDRGFGAIHEAEYWLEVAGLVGAKGDLGLEAPVGVADRSRAEQLLSCFPPATRFLAIHAGTGWYGPGRRWAPERFALAAELILQETEMVPVLLGADGDAEAAGDVAAAMRTHAINLVGQTSVGELGAVLERCTLLLANDGGVAHLASAVGTQVVAIFGPSNDRAWRPLTAEVVATDLPCRPCFYRDFETGLPNGCATRECLALVAPDMVSRAALAALRGRAVAG